MYAKALANIKLWNQEIEVESIEFFCLELFPMGDLLSNRKHQYVIPTKVVIPANKRWLYTQTQRGHEDQNF